MMITEGNCPTCGGTTQRTMLSNAARTTVCRLGCGWYKTERLDYPHTQREWDARMEHTTGAQTQAEMFDPSTVLPRYLTPGQE